MIAEQYQNQIDEIMDYFEFDKVRTMMLATNWTWGMKEIPEIAELRQEARSQLRRVAETDCFIVASGGFMAMNQDGCLSLYWGLSWQSEPEEKQQGE